MDINFFVSDCWKTENGLKALAERKVEVNNNFDRAIACLTYPTIQFIYEAWLNSGDEPCYVDINDEFDGKINFSVFVVLKGNTPADRTFLADDESGMMWESDSYVNEDVNDVDFTAENWEQSLKNRLVNVAEKFVKDNNYSFDKPNF